MAAESTSKEEEGDLEHDRQTLDEEVEWPFFQTLTLALPIPASLHHRPSLIPQVTVEPLFSQHRDKRGE